MKTAKVVLGFDGPEVACLVAIYKEKGALYCHSTESITGVGDQLTGVFYDAELVRRDGDLCIYRLTPNKQLSEEFDRQLAEVSDENYDNL